MEMITRVQELLAAEFGKHTVAAVEESGLQPALVIYREKLASVCLFLRDHKETYFDFLSSISAVDNGIESGSFRSEEHTSELQSLMRISYAVFCLKKKKNRHIENTV